MNEKELNKQIDSTNEIFKSATKAQKRAMIAQDVLDLITAKKLYPCSGNLFSLSIKRESGSLKEIFKEEQVICEVCAKGSMFLAYVNRVNDFDISNKTRFGYEYEENHHNSSELVKIQEIFTPRMLDLIEAAFEGELYINDYYSCDDEQVQRAFRFHNRYHNSNSRLVAICENIIRNKGNFKI